MDVLQGKPLARLQGSWHIRQPSLAALSAVIQLNIVLGHGTWSDHRQPACGMQDLQ